MEGPGDSGKVSEPFHFLIFQVQPKSLGAPEPPAISDPTTRSFPPALNAKYPTLGKQEPLFYLLGNNRSAHGPILKTGPAFHNS